MDEVASKNIKEIKRCFASLVMKVCSKLRTMNINMNDFRLFVDTLFLDDFLTSAPTMDEIFRAISHKEHWHYLNHDPIEAIIMEFGGEDQELSELISSYELQLSRFKATTKIIDFIKICEHERQNETEATSIEEYKRNCHVLTKKLNVNITGKCLDYIDELWRSFVGRFHIPRLPVLLESIREGCTEITWLISAQASAQIESALSSATFFSQFEITKFTLDNAVLYEDKRYKVTVIYRVITHITA